MNDHLFHGEVPTTGAARPGPVSSMSGAGEYAAAGIGIRPVALRIPTIQVDAEIERRPVVDGVMLDPTGPWVIAWYGATSRLGVPGNVVLAGHVDYAGVGPAVLARAGELVPGDKVEVTGADLGLFRYVVEWSRIFNAATPPIDVITGQTDDEVLTIITCGGTFDVARNEYLERLVIRCDRST